VELKEYGGDAAMNRGAGGAALADTKKDKRESQALGESVTPTALPDMNSIIGYMP
jgi:hypothetical protein